MGCHLGPRFLLNSRGLQITLGEATIVMTNEETGINLGPAPAPKEKWIRMFPDTMGKTIDLGFGMMTLQNPRMTGMMVGKTLHGIQAGEIMPVIQFLADVAVVHLREREDETKI